MKSLPNLLFGVLCLPGDQSHPFGQPVLPTISGSKSRLQVFSHSQGRFPDLFHSQFCWIVNMYTPGGVRTQQTGDEG